MADNIKFFMQFLGRPGQIGAVLPSSPHLARRMVETIDFDRVNTIVEFGPGTGVFSRVVLDRLRPQTLFFAIEANPVMVEHLKNHLPALTAYQDSAARVAGYLTRHGRTKTDAIVSGLPWAAFGDALQTELLTAAIDSLEPGGQFITFAYLQGLLLPAGKKFHRRLQSSFARVARSPVVWRNFPPALVYRCVK